MVRGNVALAALVLVASLAASTPPASAATVGVSVLVDFGDGAFLWGDVDVPDANQTALKAAEMANDAWGLAALEITWFDSSFCLQTPCAFVDDIGDRNPVFPAWWHFYTWNATAGIWEIARHGPSDTRVGEGDAIAWYLAEDDPVSFASPRPVPTPAFRDVWASFRGDHRNRGLAREGLPATGRIEWGRVLCPDTDCASAPLEIDAAPVVAHGMVFVVMRSWVLALDARTGETVWANRSLGGLLSTPSIYDGRLFFGGAQGMLHSVDAFTGERLWSVLLEPGGRTTGIASSPTVHLGRAYVGTFNESAGGKGKVVAVNLNNGTVAWEYDAPGVIHMSSPAIVDGRVYVGVMGTYDGLVGYDAPHGLLSLTLDGSFRWFYETEGPVAASPLLTEGMALVSDKAGNLYAIREDGTLAWRAPIGPSTSSPALGGDRLFVGAGGLNGTGSVYAFDLTGRQVWQAQVNGPVQASLITDGQLVCGGTNENSGRHFCLRASDGGEEWAVRLASPTGAFILGSPTAADGTLYTVSDAGMITAFRDADRQPPTPLGIDPALLGVGVVVLAAVAVSILGLRRRRRRKAEGVGNA